MKTQHWYFLRSYAVAVFFSILLMQIAFFALGFDLWTLLEPIFVLVIFVITIPMYVIVRKRLFRELEVISKESYYKQLERDK